MKCRWKFIFFGTDSNTLDNAGRLGNSSDRVADYPIGNAEIKLNHTVVAQAVTTLHSAKQKLITNLQ